MLMRISVLQGLLIGCLAATGFARDGEAQTILNRTISVRAENQPLKKVIDQLQTQSQVRFIYSSRIRLAEPVSLVAANEKLQSVLDRLLTPLQIDYKVINEQIVLTRRGSSAGATTPDAPIPLPDSRADQPAERKLTGRVTDATSGQGLPGVNIVVKGTNRGTQTTADGNYDLTVPNDATTIVYSFIGYVSREMPIRNQSVLNVALTADIQSLQEVVVTGYSTQSKRNVTGAVSTLSAGVVAQTPVTDLTSVLQGRVSGVTVDGQGGPGSQQVVRIRGFGTLGNNNPLYVIDGVQTKGDLNLINPNDIESMTVLKDAASAAIYGSRGANGVIVITTKRGKNGPPKVEYNTYIASQRPIKLPAMITPQQQADAFWGYLGNSNLPLTSPIYGTGTAPVLPDFVVSQERGSSPLVGAADNAATNPALYDYSNYRIFQTNKSGTDWFGEVFRPALNQNHQLSVTGGSEKSTYAVSMNYVDDQGTLLNTFFKRYSLRVNTDFAPKPWLRLGENIQLSYSQANSVGNNHSDQNVVASIFGISRLVPVYDIAGNFAGTSKNNLGGANPVAVQERSKNTKGYSARAFGSAYAEVEPIKNLVFQSRIGVDYVPYNSQFFQDVQPEASVSIRVNSLFETNGYSTEWRWTNKLSYQFDTGNDHHVDAFVGYESARATTRSAGGIVSGLFSNLPSYRYLSSGDPKTVQLLGSGDASSQLSLFGNANYSFRGKYLLSASMRRDGSSKFGSLNRYGYFPSVSAGWRVSDEPFMKSLRWLSELKLRGSWGRIGNDAIQSAQTVNQYAADRYYSFYDLNGTNITALEGLALLSVGNPQLRWETNETTNVGLDAAFLDNQFSLSFNWFNKRTKGLLFTPPQTTLDGDAIKPIQNIMNFSNRGIELEVGYASPRTRRLRFEMNANVSTYRNNVDYIDGNENTAILGGQYFRQFFLSRSVVGMPIASFYGYVHEGIFQTAEEVSAHAKQQGIPANNPARGIGHFKFKDLNNDGVVNDADRTFIGNPHPRFAYGYNLNVFFRQFDFTLFVQGVAGQQVFNYWRTRYAFPGGLGAGSLDTWSPTNTGAKLPIYSNADLGDARPSSFFIEDGSYLRLKSLSLGYTLPPIKGVSKLRVYGQAFNLLTLTRYSGIDPEINNGDPSALGIDYGGVYPIAMKLLLGLNLQF